VIDCLIQLVKVLAVRTTLATIFRLVSGMHFNPQANTPSLQAGWEGGVYRQEALRILPC